MPRIFLTMSLLAFAMLLANAALGLRIGDFNGAARNHRQAQAALRALEGKGGASRRERQAHIDRAASVSDRLDKVKGRKMFHFLFGVAAVLMAVLVNSVSITYFIGTTRWCREVSDAYSFDGHLASQSTRLKRTAFPWALGGVLVLLGIVTTGAACDPSANLQRSAEWVTVHLAVAMVGTTLVAWSFLVQWGRIVAQQTLIGEVQKKVADVRAAKGLDGELRDDMPGDVAAPTSQRAE